MKETALFISATDTNIGKTLVTALLSLKLQQLGFDCAVFKPFASGCKRENGVLISEDAEFLQKMTGSSDSLDEICPIRLEEPLAPLIAARRAGISTKLWPQIARDALENLRAKHDFVLVEGVGGLLAPIWKTEGSFASNLDLIEGWDLPAILVSRRALGTINHTLMSLKLCSRFAGLVFNDAEVVADDDIAAQTSPDFIQNATSVPIWGRVSFAPELNAQTLQKIASSLEIQF
ncbi:dethiobiotin synthase [Abditibacterium utsteinense]|uniref:ATP-dependent dethiobiotin synthetase BioD n=1 Tax=Abditibacterium utsteinense TaxID=1960156 RepID=A0A2S8SVY7_9BACT|nr:dethiobiotin synthase [Abditibacterium utsteinense]PQV64953.1 dethiobiotin synthase [Abditibacterium utsteinense]